MGFTFGLSLEPPHHVSPPRAELAPALEQAIASDVAAADIRSASEARAFALRETGRRLHFGLGHRSSLAFGLEEREGNCIEYAHLFAKILNDAARAKGVPATAYVVHSERARLFGRRLPGRGMGDHDWVLIVERDEKGRETGRQFVDPSFHDSGLGWDVRRAVSGEVVAPKRGPQGA